MHNYVIAHYMRGMYNSIAHTAHDILIYYIN